MTVENVCKGLILSIREIDYYRPPVSAYYLTRLKIQFFHGIRKRYVKAAQPEILERQNKLLTEHRRKLFTTQTELLFDFKYWILILFAFIASFLWLIMLLNIFSFSDLVNIILLSTFFSVLMPIIIFRYLIPKQIEKLNPIAEEDDGLFKDFVQGVLQHLSDLMKENDLDPKDFPIELRHNDYEGLEYVEKKKGVYTAYVKL
jgi:hypothetical protein